jgi:GntR family transcriptional regulator
MSSSDVTAPLYRLVSSRLAQEIETGALKLGDRVPSERAIGQEHSVSRTTARRALEALADDGLVEFRAGVPVVAVQRREPGNRLVAFEELARAQGVRPTAVVLTQGLRAATLDEADVLGVAPGAEVLELERVRGFDDRPCGLDRNVVARWALPDGTTIDFSSASLYDALERHGNGPAEAEYELGARLADDRECRLLELEDGAPVMVARTVCRAADGRALDMSTTTYRADRYRFTTALVRSKGERTTQ